MREVADIDVLGDEPFQARVARLSLVIFLATAFVAALLFFALGGESFDVRWWVALALGSFVALPVHELVHAAAFKLLCPGCRVSFGLKDAFLYTRTDDAVLRRGRMVAALLAPAVLVTAVLAALALAMGLPVLAALLSGLHLSGCSGDILMAAAALREGSCTHVRDTETGITLLSDREGTA